MNAASKFWITGKHPAHPSRWIVARATTLRAAKRECAIEFAYCRPGTSLLVAEERRDGAHYIVAHAVLGERGWSAV